MLRWLRSPFCFYICLMERTLMYSQELNSYVIHIVGDLFLNESGEEITLMDWRKRFDFVEVPKPIKHFIEKGDYPAEMQIVLGWSEPHDMYLQTYRRLGEWVTPICVDERDVPVFTHWIENPTL